LLGSSKKTRGGHRDATMILVAYRHGLRASELTNLRWDQIDFTTATLEVRRVKQGNPTTHPILGDELRWLRRLVRTCYRRSCSPRSEARCSRRLIRPYDRARCEAARFGFKAHPHMLRIATPAASRRHGHGTRPSICSIQCARHTELSPGVAQLIAPTLTSIAPAGQTAQPSLFLLSHIYVKTDTGWRLASIFPILVP
jgi:type 1 fimbriae regulatory protein FimB/type 1 fimbriae regulatory protein FimE